MPHTDAVDPTSNPPPALARLAYEAYTATTGNLNWRGAKVLGELAETRDVPAQASEELLEDLSVDELVAAVERLCELEGVEVPAVYHDEEPRILDDIALDHLRKNLLCPAWDDLPAGVREAWQASTAAVGRELHARVQCYIYLLTRDAVPWGTASMLVHEVIDPKEETGPPREPYTTGAWWIDDGDGDGYAATFLSRQTYSDKDAAALSGKLAMTLLELGW